MDSERSERQNFNVIMKKKLLLVDDDESIRFVAGLSLEDAWEVLTASSGQEALELAIKERPDVILLDMMMPGMNGATTMEHLRKIEGLRDVPIIFMTAKVQTHEVDDYQRLGAAGVIAKPFDPMKISEQIRQLIKNVMVS